MKTSTIRPGDHERRKKEIMKSVEARLLKYIPANMRRYVVWLEYVKCSHVYFLTFEKDGVEVSAEPADTVKELSWNARQCRAELGL